MLDAAVGAGALLARQPSAHPGRTAFASDAIWLEGYREDRSPFVSTYY